MLLLQGDFSLHRYLKVLMDRDGKFSELNPNYNNLLHPLTSPFFPVISEANDQIRSLDGPPK